MKAWKEAHGGAGYRGEARDVEGAAIRLRVPDEGETVVEDAIRGEIRFENRLLDDFVIARSDGSVLYNFAVAVDDAEMEITDVVRGDDHLSNTPRQLMVLRALGTAPPRYAHLPLLHAPDGTKLSKRHGGASVEELRAAGYLPAAVRNYLALLGWGTDDDTTLMSTEELIERFDLARVGRSAAVFDEQKLRWMNGRFMRELALDEYERRLADHLRLADPESASRFEAAPPERRRAACAIVQEKAQTLDEVWRLVRFLFEEPADDPRAWEKVMKPDTRPVLEAALEALKDGVALRARCDRAGAAGRGGGGRREAEAGLSADPGRDHRLDGVAGNLRVARGARPRRVRRADRARARASSGTGLGDVYRKPLRRVPRACD